MEGVLSTGPTLYSLLCTCNDVIVNFYMKSQYMRENINTYMSLQILGGISREKEEKIM